MEGGGERVVVGGGKRVVVVGGLMVVMGVVSLLELVFVCVELN